MEDLLNIHGKCFGEFWACETCAEVGWSPQFNNKSEMENHVNKLHMNLKSNKINLDDRICSIVNTIKSCDEWFNSLIDTDFDDCLERTKYFIGSEDKIGNLSDSNFKILIKQIENFYVESGSFDSIVKFNYNIDIIPDILTGDFVGFITESEVYQGYNCDMHKNEQEKSEEAYFQYTDKSYETSANLKDMCNISLTCEDKQFVTHGENKVSGGIMISNTPQQYYGELVTNKNVLTLTKNEYTIKDDEKVDIDMENDEIDQDKKLHEIEHNSPKSEMDEDDNENQSDNNQCNICGNILEEDLDLVKHVEDVHEDYFFNEENSFLLNESLTSNKYSVTKCTLCLESLKINYLNQHMKSLHPTEFEETAKDAKNIIKISFDEINLTDVENITIQGDNMINNDKHNNSDNFYNRTFACEDENFHISEIKEEHDPKKMEKNIEYDDVLLKSMCNLTDCPIIVEEFGTSIKLELEIVGMIIDEKLHISIPKWNSYDNVKINDQEELSNFKETKISIKNEIIDGTTYKNIYSCEKCAKTFSNTIEISVHMKSFHNLYLCDICDKTFSKADKHNIHMQTIHKTFIHFIGSSTFQQIRAKMNITKELFRIYKKIKEHVKKLKKKQNEILEVIKDWKKRRKKYLKIKLVGICYI